MLKSLIISAIIFISWNVCAADILIIANKDVGPSSLTKQTVKDIFLGTRSKWEDKKPIQFVLNGKKSVFKEFAKMYLDKTPSQLKDYWRNMVFTGKGERPKEIDSAKKLLMYVRNTEGAISFVDHKTSAADVKILKIEKEGM